MNKPKVTIIKKTRTSSCGRCHTTVNGIKCKREGCTSCNGTGRYPDYHYMLIVGNIAMDMDTIK
jgi:DnaJ-class molecular chaperone